MAVTGLLMDPAWKSVSGVIASFGSAEPAVFTPTPRAHAMRPPSMTAMLTPGTWWWAMRSSSVQRTGGRPAISTRGRRPRSTFASCGSWAAAELDGRRGCGRGESVLRTCAQGERERELSKSTHRGTFLVT